MQLFKSIRLIWTFYRSFVLVSMVITISCVRVIWDTGFNWFGLLFWGKLATLGLLFYFVNSYKNKEYYYYQNLGISKILLWATTLTFDFSLFLFLTVLAYKLK